MALSLSTAVEESEQPQPVCGLRADHISRNNMEEQLYSLRWHDFQSSILSSFRHLRDEEDFVDVTLACDGKSFTAHKMVLSACSPYFRHLLKANPCQHPIVILRDVKHRDMEALLRFMYNGEVSVSNEQLPGVLHAARMLQVKGLADVPSKNYSKRISEYSNETPSSRESSAERPVSPPRKRPRSRSRSYVEEEEIEGPLVEATYGETENGEREDKFEKVDKKIVLEVNRESLLSQALEGRSQSLMAHLLATRSSQSETSSGHGINLANVEDDASDSDDTEASDRDRTDVGELSNTEDNYPSSGMASDRPLPPEIIPPSGFPHHPLLNLQSLHSLFPSSGPPSLGVGLHNSNNDLAQATRRSLDLMRIRATDPRPCPQCGKIYRSAHTLRTHLEDKHTVCPGYRCVLCGTVAKSRNSLHSHMSRQHRGISTKDLPVVPMPAPFDPVLASCLLAKAGVKVSPAELAARASPTSGNPRGRTADLRLDFKSPNSGSVSQATIPQVTIGGLQSHRNNPVPLIPLEDPEDLSLAQQRLRERERDKDRSGGSSGVAISPYGPAGLVSRLGLSSKMGKSWLESNLAAIQPNPPVAPGGGSTGSALLDTYLQLIAEHSSNMAAAAAAAAAAAQNASASNNNNSETNNGGDLQESLLDGTLNDKRSPKATAGD